MRSLTIASALVVGGCAATSIDLFESCDLEVTLHPVESFPGETIRATGQPFTEVRDTRIQVGGADADVLTVGSATEPATTADTALPSADACDECDSCRNAAGCGPCGSCLGLELSLTRRAECFGDADEATLGFCDLCLQEATFIVPDIGAGDTTMLMINRNGSSAPVPFTVLGATSTGSTSNTGSTGSSGDTGTTVR